MENKPPASQDIPSEQKDLHQKDLHTADYVHINTLLQSLRATAPSTWAPAPDGVAGGGVKGRTNRRSG